MKSDIFKSIKSKGTWLSWRTGTPKVWRTTKKIWISGNRPWLRRRISSKNRTKKNKIELKGSWATTDRRWMMGSTSLNLHLNVTGRSTSLTAMTLSPKLRILAISKVCRQEPLWGLRKTKRWAISCGRRGTKGGGRWSWTRCSISKKRNSTEGRSSYVKK